MHRRLALLSILLLALVLRLWGAFSFLPYIGHPDEPHNLGMIRRLATSGDLNPHWFDYPTFFYYLNAALYIPYYLVFRLLGHLQSPQDIPPLVAVVMGSAFAPAPGLVIMGRLLTILVSLGCVVVAYLIARRVSGSPSSLAGLLAALFVAVAPIAIYNARFITPDTFVTFWVMLTIYAALGVLDKGQTSAYVATAVCAGLAAASKYTGGLVLAALVMAHFLRTGRGGWRDLRLYLAPLVSLAAFFVASPFVILDFPTAWADIASDAFWYSSGLSGAEGDTPRWYLGLWWTSDGFLALLAVAQMVRGVIQRARPTLLVGGFSLLYFLFIASFTTHNDRTFLPIVPLLLVLAAVALADGLQYGLARAPSTWRPWALAAAVGVVVVCVVTPLASTVVTTRQITQVDSRTTAREWIAANIPPGSHIALEDYAPFIAPDRYVLQPVSLIIDHPLKWYTEQGIEYLVFAGGRFSRYYRQPDLYAEEIAAYDSFFDQLPLVQRFTDGGLDIRIYRTTPAP